MTTSTAFLAAVLVSFAVSTILLLIVLQPLRQAIAAMCPSAAGVRFWVVFAALMLYLAPLLATVLGAVPSYDGTIAVVQLLKFALTAALLGAFAALLGIGWQIARSRPRWPGAGSGRNEQEFWGERPQNG